MITWKGSKTKIDLDDTKLVFSNFAAETFGPAPKFNLCMENLVIPETVTFEKWVPGDEASRNIVVKNVGRYPVTISHTTTSTPEFRVPFPECLQIFTGNSFRIPVTFLPTKKQFYEDYVEILADGARQRVRLCGKLPEIQVKLSRDSVCFGEQPCSTTITETVNVVNCGEKPITFSWQCVPPFKIEPQSGTLTATQVLTTDITFLAEEIAEYNRFAELTCHSLDDSSKKRVSLTLLARSRSCNYLLFQPELNSDLDLELDFESIPFGEMRQRSFSVYSTLQSDVPFIVARDEISATGLPQVTCFEPCIDSGTIPQKRWIQISVKFLGKLVNPAVTEFMTFRSGRENSSVRIRCTGSVQAGVVSISEDLLDFGKVFQNDDTQKTLILSCRGRPSALFQFENDPDGSAFVVHPAQGTIEADSYVRVQVTFCPKWPGLFRTALVCVVKMQEPIEIVAIGTCHSSTVQPLVLRPEHIENYFAPQMEKFLRKGPRAVRELVESGQLKLISDRHLSLPLPVLDPCTCVQQENMPVSGDGATQSPVEKWLHHSDAQRKELPVYLDKDEILFGYCTAGEILHKSLKFTNMTEEAVVVNWTTDHYQIFDVHPAYTVVGSKENFSFQVSFKPLKPGLFFARRLECHVMFQYLLEFQYVEKYQVIPPCTLDLSLCGHAATLQDQTLLRPTLRTCADRPIIFRDFDVNGFGFTTIQLHNPTDDSVIFHSENDPEEITLVKPRFGVIPAKTDRLVMIGVHTKPNKLLERDLWLTLNDNVKTKQKITLLALNNPEIDVIFDRKLLFPDTFAGLSIELPLKVYNNSDVPVSFQWILTQKESSFFGVEPDCGNMAPHDFITFRWTFSPKCLTEYGAQAFLRVTPFGRPFEVHRLTLCGGGCFGHISFPDTVYRYDAECVWTRKSVTLPVKNTHSFTVRACLLATVTHADGVTEAVNLQGGHGDAQLITLTAHTFDLPAGTHENVVMTFAAMKPGLTVFQFSSQPLLPDDVIERVPPQLICTIHVRAFEPQLEVVDICGSGHLDIFGKYRLWNLLGIDRLNQLLRQPSDASDRLENVLYFGASNIPSINTQHAVAIDMGTAVLDETASIRLVLRNPGPIPCTWKVLFLETLMLKMKKGIPVDTLPQDYLSLRATKLMEMHPCGGTVEPEMTSEIRLTCTHTVLGEHLFPMLLQIDKGKLIFLQLRARTIGPEDSAVILFQKRMTFPPAVVTVGRPQQKLVELYNSGNRSISFSVKLATDGPSEHDANSAKIFHIGEHACTVQPRSFSFIPVTFDPVAARNYKVTMKIGADNGDVVDLRLTGRGCTSTQYKAMIKDSVSSGGPSPTGIISESQLLTFSTTHMEFQCVPVWTTNRQIFFVTSAHTKVLRFKWSGQISSAHQSLAIEPAAGTIRPGESLVLTATYVAGSRSSVFAHTLELQFVEDEAMLKYQEWLKEWVAEVRERCRSFTITGSNQREDELRAQALQCVAELEATVAPASSGAGLSSQSSSGNFSCLLKLLEIRPDVRVPKLRKEPVIHNLHLTISGQAIDRRLFAEAYPGKINQFRCYAPRYPTDMPNDVIDLKPEESREVTSMTTSILEQALKAVLTDDIKEDVEEIMKQPFNLYYGDLVAKRSDDVTASETEASSASLKQRASAEKTAIPHATDVSRKGTGNIRRNMSEDSESFVEVLAVSPRLNIDKRQPVLVQPSAAQSSDSAFEEKLEMAETSEEAVTLILQRHQEEADIFRDPIFQQVSDKIIHDLICSIIQDARNSSFDLFGRPKFLVAGNADVA